MATKTAPTTIAAEGQTAKKKTAARKAPARKTKRKKKTAKKKFAKRKATAREKKKTAKKRSARKKRSAKKKSSNMSEAIRAYLKTHKNATAKETQDALAKKGIKVSEALIYNVRGRMGKKKAAKKKVKVRVKKKAAERSPIEDMKEAGSLMVKAVELVVSAGAAEAKQLISTASEIVKKAQGGD